VSTVTAIPTSEWPEVIRAIRGAKIRVIGQDDIKNEAHAAVATAVIRSFGDSPAGFVYMEPCTPRSTQRPPDVVLCHPEVGLVVFEVKGYSSSFIESVKAGSLLVRHQGLIRPVNAFRQAEQAMYDIKHQCERASGSGAVLPAFNAIVALPNISQHEWNNRGFSACFPEQVLLLRDDLDPDRLKTKLKKLVAGRHGSPLTPEQINTIKAVFGDSATINETRQARPDIVESSLGAVIDELATMDKYLSAEQTELSRLPIGGFPRLVRGVAGSGKTIVLANLAARLLNRQQNANPTLFDNCENEHLRVAVICFNRSLVSFLRQKIKDAYKQQTFEDIPSKDILWVGHLNGLMRKVTYGRGLNYISPMAIKDSSERAKEYIEQLQAYRTDHPEEHGKLLYDAIFVDEGQDFEPEEFQLLLSLLKTNETTGEKNLVIFYDDAQNLYGRHRPNWKQIGIDVGRGDRARVMKECFRNTREIVETAFNVLLGAESSAESKVKLKTYADVGYLRQAGLVEEVGGFYKVGFAERVGDYPHVQVFASRQKEKEWIAGEVQRLLCTERVRPEDLLILFNYPLVFEDLSDMIRARLGKEYLLNFVKPFGKGGDQDTFIFKEKCLTLSTVHGAKGYDAYVVFLAGADLFREDEAGRASFYVGATRAKLALHVTGLKSAVLTEAQQVIGRARSLRAGGSLGAQG
jgi:superfamily I DNA and RNA helicase